MRETLLEKTSRKSFDTQMKDKVNNLDKELKDRHTELESLKVEFAKLEK